MGDRRRSLLGITLLSASFLAPPLTGCGGKSAMSKEIPGVDASVTEPDGASGLPEDAGASEGCDAGWMCQVDESCTTPTTLTGRVFDPAGNVPLPNVAVYVPDYPAALAAISRGSPVCSYDTITDPFVTGAVTDANGKFKLTGVPTGSGVPVTVQIGKWRRTVFVDVANDCGANTAPDGVLRLPRSRAEGDLPQMALLTGADDNIACFLAGIGVDPREFGPPGGGGSVDVYRGAGGADLPGGQAGDCSGTSCPLWDTPDHLSAYDVLVLGCEGGENLQTKPPPSVQAVHDWILGGGQVFGVHSEDVWFARGPADFQGLATWLDGGSSGAPGPFRIANTATPLGAAFRTWAIANGGGDADGGLPLPSADLATSVGAVARPAQAWIVDESTADAGASFPGNAKALSARVPSSSPDGEAVLGCGRVMLTDIHPGGTAPVSPVPSACPGGLSAEERVLEYLFFQGFTWPPAPPCLCPPPPPVPVRG